jgi:hypothetical protein
VEGRIQARAMSTLGCGHPPAPDLPYIGSCAEEERFGFIK